MVRDAWLVLRKDLRIEWRSKVTTSQIAPFAVLILILFAFALDNVGTCLNRNRFVIKIIVAHGEGAEEANLIFVRIDESFFGHLLIAGRVTFGFF